jgi:hypothetical protein
LYFLASAQLFNMAASELTMTSIFSQSVEQKSEQHVFICTEEARPEACKTRSELARKVVLAGLALAGVCVVSIAVCNVLLVLAALAPSALIDSRHSRFLQATGSPTSAEMQEVLDKHNVYRCMHGVPALTWDADIAANAQAWADSGVWGHSPKPRTVNGKDVGENIGWGTSRTGPETVIAWYSEIQYKSPYGLAESSSDSVVEGETVGHYTAVVWKSTTRLGCGKGRATINGNEGDYWVCEYGNSRGNTNWLFKETVLEPATRVSACGGTSSEIPDIVSTSPLCQYIATSNTAVKSQGTGGNMLKRASYESETTYLEACKANCNADSTCGGFVDDPMDRRGRMCKPQTASVGYPKALKTFYRKGSGC